MNAHGLIAQLRQQRFYRGQILGINEIPGKSAQTQEATDVVNALPHLASGSLRLLLSSLGMEQVYATCLAGLRNAYPEAGQAGGQWHGDAILVACPSLARENVWKLICLLDALDRSSVTLVLCSNEDRARRTLDQINDLIQRADVAYAVQAAGLFSETDLGIYGHAYPMVLVLTPSMLLHLLVQPEAERLRSRILNAVERIVLPSLNEWPPAFASNTAILMRKLNIEMWRREKFPSVVATLSPAINLDLFLPEFLGRPVPPNHLIRDDSVECVPLSLVYYSGAMVRDPDNPAQWIRQTMAEVVAAHSGRGWEENQAAGLMEYLVGLRTRSQNQRSEIHYVLDTSGSMGGQLPAVKEAILCDFRAKIKAGALRTQGKDGAGGDAVRLSVFDTDAREIFFQEIASGTEGALGDSLAECEAGGCTDLPLALHRSLESSIGSGASAVEVVMFSDGMSGIEPKVRSRLLSLSQNARAVGISVGIVYVLLDFKPPTDISNLFRELGGFIVSTPSGQLHALDLSSTSILDLGDPDAAILFLAGDNALPASVLQPFFGGRRRLIYTRDTSKLQVEPKSVAAVVVSGRFTSQREILNQVGHLGNGRLPVFILVEPEAWSRAQQAEFVSRSSLDMALLASPDNESVRRRMLSVCMGADSVEEALFWYLLEGAAKYGAVAKRMREGSSREPVDELPPLPDGYLRTVGQRIESIRPHSADEAERIIRLMDIFGERAVVLEGEGISTLRDASTAALTFHIGATVDSGELSARVNREPANGKVALTGRDLHRYVPILSGPVVEPRQGAEVPTPAKSIQHLGTLRWGAVSFRAELLGVRRYARGNLDDSFRDEKYQFPLPLEFPSRALQWKPEATLAQSVLIGLANLLRMGLPSLFRYIEQTLLVLPDVSAGAIWIIDMAPHGNGASYLLFERHELLKDLLAIGGRILLDCPCEGGFAGATHETHGDPLDTGCPRCGRVIGPVILGDAGSSEDLMRTGSKRATLEWLQACRHLPSSAAAHLTEKYEGVEDRGRVVGPSVGTRRAILPTVQKIYNDRLGLRLDNGLVARFEWMAGSGNGLGTYYGGENKIDMLKGLREWFALDVFSHEYFHNLQYQLPALFDHNLLGRNGSENPPYDGKLFIEGSAMWAESHIVDALAIRSSLNLANLREGDEYGEGFQLMKWIEENCGGVPAVLDFLATGDIVRISGRKVRDLMHLYSVSGILDKLRERGAIKSP